MTDLPPDDLQHFREDDSSSRARLATKSLFRTELQPDLIWALNELVTRLEEEERSALDATRRGPRDGVGSAYQRLIRARALLKNVST